MSQKEKKEIIESKRELNLKISNRSNHDMVASKILPLTDEEIQKKKHEIYGSTYEKQDFKSQYQFPEPTQAN